MGINDLYLDILNEIWHRGSETQPRNYKCKEILCKTIICDPNDNIITLKGVETNLNYAITELAWYESGRKDINFHKLIKKIWTQYSDDDVSVNSAYGYYLFNQTVPEGITQWEWVKNKLKTDKDSRQCVFNINQVSHKYNSKDIPCTIGCQVLVRENKLYWITVMRSNDVFKGFRNDLYCFTELQKKLAKELDLDCGNYIHIANSLHLYEDDFEKVEKVLKEAGKL